MTFVNDVLHEKCLLQRTCCRHWRGDVVWFIWSKL